MKYVIQNKDTLQFVCRAEFGDLWDANLQNACTYNNIVEAEKQAAKINGKVIAVKETEVIVKKLERL